MGDIFPKVDDVIQKPDAAAYASRLKRTRPDSTGIVNYGLGRLVDIEEQLDEQALMDRYAGDLASTNEQRSKLAQMAAAANAEMEARGQDLTFGAATRDTVPLSPIMERYGVPMDADLQATNDRATTDTKLADIAKKQSEVAKNYSDAAGDGSKKKLKRGYDQLAGKPTLTAEGDWSVQELIDRGVDPNVARETLSGKGPHDLIGDQASNAGGQSFQNQAAVAAAPITAKLPSGQSLPAADLTPAGDGTFIGTINTTKGPARVRIKADGSYAGRAE